MTHHPRKNLRKAITRQRRRLRKPSIKRLAGEHEEPEIIGPGNDAKSK